MNMQRSVSRSSSSPRPGLLAFTCLLATSAEIRGQSDHPAVNKPDHFAWALFQEINKPSDPVNPDGPVIWETWALASEIFRDPSRRPEWPSPPSASSKNLEPLPLQQEIFLRNQTPERGKSVSIETIAPLVDPAALPRQGNETRMNRDAFDFVVNNDLYFIEGQEAFFQQGRKIDFPVPSKEIKAQWRPINDSDKPRHHWAIVDGKAWGLTSLHITTKDLPNWFWATWEHKDNQGREAVVPSRDSAGLPVSLKGTKWENYVLRGTQVDFVTSLGQPTILASSQVEHGFQSSSSCITCHARATIGEIPRLQFQSGPNGPVPLPREANRLDVFENNGPRGAVGIPQPSWYLDAATVPSARNYIQTDFVWSLFRARRRDEPRLGGPSPAVALSPFSRLHDSRSAPQTLAKEPSSPARTMPQTLPVPASRVLVKLNKGERLPADLRPRLEKSSAPFEAFSKFPRICTLETSFAADTAHLDENSVQQNIFYVRPPTLGIHVPNNSPRNMDAAVSHLVPQLRATYELSGSHLTTAVFDEGGVRATHREFLTVLGDLLSSRVKLDTTLPLSSHSTHVAGTIAASGRNITATGMAPGVGIVSLDWHDDIQFLNQLAGSVAVTNHSYGKNTGWTWIQEEAAWGWWGIKSVSSAEDCAFGAYTPETQQLDEVLARNPSLITVVAAGNDRNDSPGPNDFLYEVVRSSTGLPLRYEQTATRYPADNSDHGGLDTISGLGIAKNAITIGSIEDITVSNDTVRMTTYSSWGPTDDYRLKPDLVANGDWLTSTSHVDDISYENLPGTSMASPVCAGICALLVEHYSARKGEAPSAADIKAVLIHTARDSGVPGPDPSFGWGSINALRAGQLIAAENGEIIQKLDVSAGTPVIMKFKSNGSAPVRVTVVWTDPPGIARDEPALDDPSPVLMNDVDALLKGPGGTFHPWSLHLQNPASGSRRDVPNHADNVEVIDALPAAGDWQLTLTDSGFKSGTIQRVSIVISGLHP